MYMHVAQRRSSVLLIVSPYMCLLMIPFIRLNVCGKTQFISLDVLRLSGVHHASYNFLFLVELINQSQRLQNLADHLGKHNYWKH